MDLPFPALAGSENDFLLNISFCVCAWAAADSDESTAAFCLGSIRVVVPSKIVYLCTLYRDAVPDNQHVCRRGSQTNKMSGRYGHSGSANHCGRQILTL